MFYIYKRMHRAAIGAKCALRKLVDIHNIDNLLFVDFA